MCISLTRSKYWFSFCVLNKVQAIKWLEEHTWTFFECPAPTQITFISMISLVPTITLREAFYPHFTDDKIEAVGLSALTEPAGGAPPGVSEEPAGCLRPMQPPDESYREVQGRELGSNEVFRKWSHSQSVFFTWINVIIGKSKEK